ncbi:uncharacterized protein MONOS_10110 [Monocercomonoides exilis]|uniref:uncharacterized protein n=1 Tax=Monocercomonoides exilis TaxID=2049356 RepID=UPI00355ABB0C|nr:hypothetical protein MONOS_10110 [Monocercomonoides exilis]|eukprot:MONOS_10110.1-p1 / transcript=MONOS_10110.1 / gene=MONOS_10110 / organism=Monocercomonoides_exilis_PA203 / gene_product=unspecified product / transcript_product=unspecified product / location=Mono_scaffold00445:4814-6107(-) / protein_length=177 / sequence_SO=supercontig / SO=protein_coding / is_pseudo=false
MEPIEQRKVLEKILQEKIIEDSNEFYKRICAERENLLSEAEKLEQEIKEIEIIKQQLETEELALQNDIKNISEQKDSAEEWMNSHHPPPSITEKELIDETKRNNQLHRLLKLTSAIKAFEDVKKEFDNVKLTDSNFKDGIKLLQKLTNDDLSNRIELIRLKKDHENILPFCEDLKM